MPDDGSPAAARPGRRLPPRRPRIAERPEPQGDAADDGAARQTGPWPLWSTALPVHADARVATGPVHGTEPPSDPGLATTLFRTWINGPCKTVYCCALEGVQANGVLTLGADGKATANAVEALAHDVMSLSGGPISQKPGFRVHAIAAEPASVRHEILDAVADAPWSSGICFLYDPQSLERSVILAALGVMPPATAAGPAADEVSPEPAG